MKAVGIVPALFIMGFFLCKFNIASWLGIATIFISILIGVTYGALGVIGILKNMEVIEIKKTEVSLSDLNIFKKNKN